MNCRNNVSFNHCFAGFATKLFLRLVRRAWESCLSSTRTKISWSEPPESATRRERGVIPISYKVGSLHVIIIPLQGRWALLNIIHLGLCMNWTLNSKLLCICPWLRVLYSLQVGKAEIIILLCKPWFRTIFFFLSTVKSSLLPQKCVLVSNSVQKKETWRCKVVYYITQNLILHSHNIESCSLRHCTWKPDTHNARDRTEYLLSFIFHSCFSLELLIIIR